MANGVRRYLIWAAAIAAAVGLYAAAGFFGVPRLVRSNLQEFAAEKYGRQLAVGDIRFNPFTLALEMRAFSLPDADTQPLLAFQRLFVNFEFSSLWRRGASFSEIVLEQPFARVLMRPNGELNLADLTKPFAQKAPPEQGDSAPARVFIDRFSVRGGRCAYEDRTRAPAFRADLQPIAFELRDFSTTGKTDNTYSLRGASAADERFAWDGEFQLNPLSSRGHFEVANLRARTLWNYLRESLHFEIDSGVVGLTGDYEFAAGGAQPVDLKVGVHTVAVTDLGVKAPGAQSDVAKVAKLDIRDTRLDLAKQSVTVGKVHLSGGELHAWLDEQGQLNLRQLVGPKEPEPRSNEVAATSGPEPETSWTVLAPDISVEQTKVLAEDRQVTPVVALRLDAMNLEIAGFSSAPDAQLDIRVNAGLNGSADIKATAKVTPQSGALAAHAELTGLDLTAFQPYIAQRTALTLLSGKLSARLDVQSSAEGDLTVRGDGDVTQLRTVDNALKQDFIKWERVRVAGLAYDSQPARLKIDTIVARKPYARVIVAPDRTVNIAEVLTAPGEPQPAKDAPAQKPAANKQTTEPGTLPIAIGSVSIRDGSANFADFWIQPNFATGIQSLNGAVVGLSSAANSRAKVELDGKVDRYAPVQIRGAINPLAAAAYSDVRMNFKNLELTTATPYSGRFAGYKIEKGKLSVDLNYKVENRQLNANHRFVIDQLQLGEKVESPDAVHLPLKLAVALLKDRNGVIDVGLPVTGSLDDPKFRLGPIIWKAVINLLTKIVTAPFAALGNLFGGGEEMNLIDFDPGSAALDDAGREKMASLSKAMQERPQLELNVPITYSPDVDRPALAQQQLQEKLLAIERSEKNKKRREKKLQEALIEETPVPDEQLEALGKERARVIQDALLGDGAIDVARVFVINAPPKAATADKVRVEMSLK